MPLPTAVFDPKDNKEVCRRIGMCRSVWSDPDSTDSQWDTALSVLSAIYVECNEDIRYVAEAAIREHEIRAANRMLKKFKL